MQIMNRCWGKLFAGIWGILFAGIWGKLFAENWGKVLAGYTNERKIVKKHMFEGGFYNDFTII